MAKVSRNELIAVTGGAALAIGLFLPYYGTSDNPNAAVGSCSEPNCDVTGFDVHDILRWLLLLAAISPFVLTYVIARGHKLSWARGEMTAVVAIAAFGLVAYTGFLDRPGAPNGAISLQPAFYGALLGTILMIVGGSVTAGQNERVRKPPGVL